MSSVELVLETGDEKNGILLWVKAWSDDFAVFLIPELCNRRKHALQFPKMFCWTKAVKTNKPQNIPALIFLQNHGDLLRHLEFFQTNRIFSYLEIL